MTTFPLSLPPSPTIVLGTFDGVHLGHQALLAQGKRLGKPIVVYTFQTAPHGAAFLTPPSDRRALLEACGADTVIFDSFDEVRGLSPDAFVQDILKNRLGAGTVICGFNYRFGQGAVGDANMLSALLQKEGIALFCVDAILMQDAPISSTRIRRLLTEGKPDAAAEMLGRPFFYHLPVLHGKHLGSTIGIPTANQRIPADLVTLKRGVYAAIASTEDGESYPAIANIGHRPTVNADESDVTCETHLIGFSGDLYGKCLKVSFLSYLREEVRFPSLDALRNQIRLDMDAAMPLIQAVLPRKGGN